MGVWLLWAPRAGLSQAEAARPACQPFWNREPGSCPPSAWPGLRGEIPSAGVGGGVLELCPPLAHLGKQDVSGSLAMG